MATDQQKIEAAEADRLRLDPAFQAAMREARLTALESLSVVAADKPDAIRELQATIRAIDMLATTLGYAIIRGSSRDNQPVT